MKVVHATVGVLYVLVFTGGLGCSEAPAELTSEVGPASHRATRQAAAPIPGYIHSLAVSKFRIGQSPAIEVDSPTFRRWRGSLGAFAVDQSNGLAMGVLDATSSTGPYVLDTPTHEQMVQSYFISAGLPANQVGPVLTTYMVGGGGAMAATSSTGSQLTGLTSTVSRVVNGIRIMDSWAAARIKTTGDVDWESVFWPPIDGDLVAGALAFATSMADPVAHSAFMSALPGSVRSERGVVIDHTRPGQHYAPVCYVSFDVFIGPDTSSGERHFDASGTEFKLPQEIETQSATPR